METFNEQTGEEIDYREFPVTMPTPGNRIIPLVIAPTPIPNASYNVIAAFYTSKARQPEDEGNARFGVRPTDFPAGIPDHILKAEVETINVPEILKNLKQCNKYKSPVEINVGSETVKVQVTRQELLAKGVAIPGIGRPDTFVGKIVNDKGEVEEESLAVFSVANGQLSGTLNMPVDTTGEPPSDHTPKGSTESLTIQPVSDMQHHSGAKVSFALEAPPALHIAYKQKDTTPPPQVGPEGHGEPVADVPPLAKAFAPSENQAALLPESPALALAAAAPTTRHQVNLQVYQDHDTGISPYHYNLIVTWANQLRAKFVGITRYTGLSAVVVDSVFITKWQQISAAGYGTSCSNNLSKFYSDTERGLNGPISTNTLQVLFTTQGTDCGGIAYVGQPGFSGARMYSITRDTSGSSSYDAMVLMQEIGHNLDWHNNWCLRCSPPTPHDGHLAPEISESYTHFHFFSLVGPFIGDSKHCTAMQGGYGGCQEPEPVYSWGFGTPLTHLAEGIAQLFPGF